MVYLGEVMQKILNFLLIPWHKYQQRKLYKQRLAELKRRDPFIYK